MFGRANLSAKQTSLVNPLKENQCGPDRGNKSDYQHTNNVPSRECTEGVTSNALKYGASTLCICRKYKADVMSYKENFKN
jgi:hypothetical protein